jgi:lincosamide nucleotidyltransferase
MDKKTQLLNRLEQIGRSLAQTDHALALIGLGSVGLELDRLDDYSDLDFFVIVQPGHKQQYIQNLDWLSTIAPIAYAFLNTPDGYKLLFADGIFCEFAVFEPDELAHIPFAPGRLIWKHPDTPDTIATPSVLIPQSSSLHSVEWLLGEALTNLYVGLGRFHRGEKLTAARFIQHYAVDRVLELAPHLETPTNAHRDPFANERRFEQRHPTLAQHLPNFIQGYDRSPQSAAAILTFLEQHFPIPAPLATEIRRLCSLS